MENYLETWAEYIETIHHDSIAIVVGVFGLQGNLLYTNAGMRVLLNIESPQTISHAPIDYFLNPQFNDLTQRPVTDDPIFEGLLTMGDGLELIRTVKAKIYRKNDNLLIIGEYDVMELDSLNRQMAALNREVNTMQRTLIKEGVMLKRALDELKETQTMLVHSEKMNALGKLVAGVAHEMNNPIAYVSSNLHSLKESMGDIVAAYTSLETLVTNKEQPELQTEANDIREAYDLDFIFDDFDDLFNASTDGINRVQKIIQDLRTFSRLDESHLKEIDLSTSINSTLSLVEPELKKRHISVELNLSNLPPVLFYAAELNQVFLNITVNAIQAMSEGGKLEIRGREIDNNIQLEFADTGVGIASDIIDKIFDPFFTTKPVGSGTGLGLSLAYKIITEKHGGRLAVSSQVNVGTCFTIVIPKTILLEKEDAL